MSVDESTVIRQAVCRALTDAGIPIRDDYEFDLSSAKTLRLGRPKNRAWAKALQVVQVAGVLGGLAAGAEATSWAVRAGNTEIKVIELKEAVFAAKHDRFIPSIEPKLADQQYVDVNPSDSPLVKQSASARAAWDSTVLLVAFKPNGDWMAYGSGTVLKDTSDLGHPVVLTVQHVLGYEVNPTQGAFLAAFDHSGHYLGCMNPIERPGAYQWSRDLPTLVAFDPKYPVAEERLSKIPGVKVGDTLSISPIPIRDGYGGTAVVQGDSGGGVYAWQHGELRIVGVNESILPATERDFVHAEAPAVMPSGSQQYVTAGKQYGYLPKTDDMVASSLGEPDFLPILKAVSTGPVQPNLVAGFSSQKVISFGFGQSIASMAAGIISTTPEAHAIAESAVSDGAKTEYRDERYDLDGMIPIENLATDIGLSSQRKVVASFSPELAP